MSFLGSLFKKKAEVPAAKPKATPQAVTPKKPVVTVRPAAAKPKPQEMKLEDIVSALRQIQEVVGGTEDASAEPTTASKLASIELRLKDIINILPEAFDPEATKNLSSDEKTEILIEDIYAQLAKGRIQTSIKHFLAGVSKQFLTSGYDAQSKKPVTLPLPLVVSVIDPAEFKKHTSGVERDLGIKDVPDVFAGANRQKPLSAILPPPAEPGAKPAPAAAPAEKPKSTIRIQPSAAVPVPEAKPAEPKPAEPVTGIKPEPKPEPKLAPKPEPKPEPQPELKAEEPKPEPKPEFKLKLAKPTAPSAPPPSKPVEKPAEPKPDEPVAEQKVQPVAPPTTKPTGIPVPKAGPLPPEKKPLLTTLKSLSDIPLAEKKPPVEPQKPTPAAPAQPVAETPPTPAPLTPPVEEKPAAAPAAPAMPAKIAMPLAGLGEGIVAPKPAAAAAEAPIAPISPTLMIRGIDLNKAGVEDLEYRLDGVARQLAERIVENRAQKGPFHDLYDLARVPGLGFKALEKITGQAWSGEIYRMLPAVIQIIGPWNARIPDLAGIVERFKAVPGFEGGVIVHRDGDLLATSWDRQASESLEVMAPQIVKRVAQYMKHVCEDEALSVNVIMEGRAMTFVQNGDICLVAIHTARGFSKRHLQIVHGLGMVLGQRLRGGK